MVEAVKKDQEGDASAALSLYCKALEYFVPALHCESTRGGERWAPQLVLPCYLGEWAAPRGKASLQPTPTSIVLLSSAR